MDLPTRKKSSGGVLDNIKGKLGFSQNSEEYDDYSDEEYYDDYDQDYADDADDYGEYGYDSRSDNNSSYRGRGQSSRYSSTNTPLVSMDDVRANTQIPDSLNRDPLPSRNAASTSRSTDSSRYGARVTERASDYTYSTPTSDNHNTAAPRRSEGVDSLFSSTTSSNAASYDPYDAYAGSTRSSHNPTRSVTVLKPVSYGEVETVAKVLKAGDAVILSLRNTPDQLAKRILDFSFGVSSALDARVECIADKVFSITRGNPLSDQEKMNLRSQGVL